MFSVVSLLIISCPRIKDSLTIPLGGGAVTGTCFTSLPSFTSPLADVVTPTFASFFLNEFFVFSKPLLSPAVGLIDQQSLFYYPRHNMRINIISFICNILNGFFGKRGLIIDIICNFTHLHTCEY